MGKKLKAVDIKGKAYVEVNERLKHFRSAEEYAGYSLISAIESVTGGVVIIKATIKNAEGVAIATGHAYEKEGSNFINKTSYIENCETSAWGRALGNLGIGIDVEVRSANEMLNASIQQRDDRPEPNWTALMATLQGKTPMSDDEAGHFKNIWLMTQDYKPDGVLEVKFKAELAVKVHRAMKHWPSSQAEEEEAIAMLDKEFKKA